LTDSKAGTLVQTTDGNTYIVVPDDAPDARGNTGVLFFVPPHPKYVEANGIPVFARSGSAVPEDALTPEQQWRADQLRAVAESLDADVAPIDPAPAEPDPGIATLIDDAGPKQPEKADDNAGPAAKPKPVRGAAKKARAKS